MHIIEEKEAYTSEVNQKKGCKRKIITKERERDKRGEINKESIDSKAGSF